MKLNKKTSLLLILFLSLLFNACSNYDVKYTLSEILNPDITRITVDGIKLGSHVDIYEDLVITSYNHGACIFQKKLFNWALLENITLPDSCTVRKVAIGENFAVLGYHDINYKKYVNIYQKSNLEWELDTTITTSTNYEYKNFGNDIDICDENIVIGAEGGPIPIYSLLTEEWQIKNEIWIDTLITNEFMDIWGPSVEISQDRILVYMLNQVNVYKYEGQSLVNEKTILLDNDLTSTSDGISLGISDSIFVFSTKSNTDMPREKKVFIYNLKNTGWEEDTTLTLFVNMIEHTDICIDDDYLVVCIQVGSVDCMTKVYVYKKEPDNWEEVKNDEISLCFGYETAISNKAAVFSSSRGAYVYNYK